MEDFEVVGDPLHGDQDFGFDSDDEVVLPDDVDPKGYYLILGVSRNDSFETIRQRFKERSVLLHPDRHSHTDPFSKHLATVKFQQLTEAYNTLSNPQLRAAYDTSGLVGSDASRLLALVPANIQINDLRRALRMLHAQSRHREIIKTLSPHMKVVVPFNLAPHPSPPTAAQKMIVVQLPSGIRIDTLATILQRHGHLGGVPATRRGFEKLFPTNLAVEISATPPLPPSLKKAVGDDWTVATTASADTRAASAAVELLKEIADGGRVSLKAMAMSAPWSTSGGARVIGRLDQRVSDLSSLVLTASTAIGSPWSWYVAWERHIARHVKSTLSFTHQAGPHGGVSIGWKVHGTRQDRNVAEREAAAVVGERKAILWSSYFGRWLHVDSVAAGFVRVWRRLLDTLAPPQTTFVYGIGAGHSVGASLSISMPPSQEGSMFAQGAKGQDGWWDGVGGVASWLPFMRSRRSGERAAGGGGGGGGSKGGSQIPKSQSRVVRRALSMSVGSVLAPLQSLFLGYTRTSTAVVPVHGPISTSLATRWAPLGGEASWEVVVRARTTAWHFPLQVSSAASQLPIAAVALLAALPFCFASALAVAVKRVVRGEDKALVVGAYAADANAAKVRADIAAAYQRLVEEASAGSAALEQASNGLVIVNAKYGVFGDGCGGTASSGGGAVGGDFSRDGAGSGDGGGAEDGESEGGEYGDTSGAAAEAHPMYDVLQDLSHGPTSSSANDAAVAAAASRLGVKGVYDLRPRGWAMTFDVTRTLQALVNRGRLVIPAESDRTKLDGFADLSPPSLRGTLPRVLQVTYSYGGAMHRATIPDGHAVELPQRAHLIGRGTLGGR